MNINKIYKMKNSKLITKAVLLSVAMAGVMTSCQKDEFQSEMVLPSHEMSQKLLAHQELTLRYWIDGVEHNQEFASQQEMDEYISYLNNVSGYTLKEIQNRILGTSYGLHSLRQTLKSNLLHGTTAEEIDELINNYDGYGF